MKSFLPRPPSTGHPVCVNRLRHSASSETSKKPALLDIDRWPGMPPSATQNTTQKTSTQPSGCRELSGEKELPSLRTAGTDTLSGKVSPASVKLGACQEHEVLETDTKSSSIPCSLTSEDSLLHEAKSSHVIQEEAWRQSEVKMVATAEWKTTSAAHDLAVVEPKKLNISRGRTKPVNKLVKTAKSTGEAYPTCSSKSLASSGRPPADHVHCDLRHQLNDARSKFASVLASTSDLPMPTATKRARARNEGNITIRSLDVGEARNVSGLLTSLMQGSSSQLSSAGCYQVVRTGKNSSSVAAKSPQLQATYSKPLTSVSLKHLENLESI